MLYNTNLPHSVSNTVADTTEIQLVKEWSSEPSKPGLTKTPYSELKTVTIDNFNASNIRDIGDDQLYRFERHVPTDKESQVPTYVSDCTLRQPRVNAVPGMGCLSPHNKIHLYDTVLFPTCLEEEDNSGKVHGNLWLSFK